MFTGTANNSFAVRKEFNLFIDVLCAVQCNKVASKAGSSLQNKMNISYHVMNLLYKITPLCMRGMQCTPCMTCISTVI